MTAHALLLSIFAVRFSLAPALRLYPFMSQLLWLDSSDARLL